MQEMASPELQSMALEAKKAAALVKYMPLPEEQLPEVARILGSAPSLQPWMARGSALAFMQVRGRLVCIQCYAGVGHLLATCCLTCQPCAALGGILP